MAAEWLNSTQQSEDEKTFQQAAEEYIEIKTPVLSPTTIHEYKSELRNHFDRFANMRLNDITPQLVQDWVNSIAAVRSAKTVRNVYGFFLSFGSKGFVLPCCFVICPYSVVSTR